MLTPLDEHGDLVKLPGDTEIELLDLSHTGDDQRLGLWRFSADQLAASWHKGVIGSGFLLRLPWQKVPTNDKLTLVARLKSADGRKFDATTQLTVSPPAESAMVAERMDDIPPSKYRIKAEPISAPRRLPRVVKEAMPEDTPISKPKLPPVSPESMNDELEFESMPSDETTGLDAVEGDLEDEAPAAIPSDDDRAVVEESDRWTLNDVPVLR
ncbi:MAG: hypothetical protein NT069_13190 [Planctomycetota bacterium]|nr:hypothetical protein [Planctomycetota bacterium]